MCKPVECIHLASEFSKSIKTSKQASKVSNKSTGKISIRHNDPCDSFTNLSQLRIKNINRLIIGYLNINSISGKFDQLMPIIEKNIDALILTETKINASFLNSQFLIDGYSPPFGYDRNTFGGGVLIYTRDDIPFKELSEHKFQIDIEEIFIEINFRKTKWLVL